MPKAKSWMDTGVLSYRRKTNDKRDTAVKLNEQQNQMQALTQFDNKVALPNNFGMTNLTAVQNQSTTINNSVNNT